jgi:hypothetical protein
MILSACIAIAADSNPYANINMQGKYGVKNSTYFNTTSSNGFCDSNGCFGSINISDMGDNWVNITGDTWTGNMDANGYSLTNLGELVVTTITLQGNLTPATDNLYSLGNSTNWFKEIYVHNIFADKVNASEVNTTELNAGTIGADDGSIDNLSTNEMNMGGIRITNQSEDIVVVLTG